MHAERDLRFADLSQHSIAQIRRLALLAMDDKEQAKRFAMQVYEKRLDKSGE